MDGCSDDVDDGGGGDNDDDMMVMTTMTTMMMIMIMVMIMINSFNILSDEVATSVVLVAITFSSIHTR